MKKTTIQISLFILVIFLGSCSYKILPYYTSVDKILELEQGMSFSNVNEKLGIEPYDILFMEDSCTVYEYYYRIKNRNMTINSKKDINRLNAQTKGILWYNDPSRVYVKFNNGKLDSYITLSGMENGEYLLLDKNNIRVINEEDLIDLQKESNSSIIILEGSGKALSTVKVIENPDKNSIVPLNR